MRLKHVGAGMLCIVTVIKSYAVADLNCYNYMWLSVGTSGGLF